jgi:1,4-alpha-glucan branching enzyme
MYTGMMKNYHTPSIDTAIDMHKLIRFLTAACARNGYLNFMGNEFGHPEWIDFPREGNGWSYHYARRQWSLVDNPDYKYEWLSDFDRDMTSFVTEHDLYEKGEAKSIFIDDNKNVLVFERNGLIFVFNLHPTQSQESVFVSCKKRGSYRAVFSSDKKSFGGYDRISDEYVYHTKKTPCGLGFEIYLPCRSCAVLEKIKINKN